MIRLNPPRQPGGEDFRHLDEERHESDKWHISSLRIMGDSFAESENPVHAMSAILYAYDAGVVPPVWAMDWLADGFRSYLDNEGREDIAQSLGTRAEGRGKAQPVQAYFADAQRSYLAWIVYILNCAFNVPIGDAAVMVWAREHGMEDDPDGKKAGWLEEQYRRRWRKEVERSERESEEVGAGTLRLFTDEKDRRTFLETFPPEAIPNGMK